MAHLYTDTGVKSLYTDRKFMGGKEGWQDALETSNTLYIGNLSFYTTEEQLYELFSRCGELKRVVPTYIGGVMYRPLGLKLRNSTTLLLAAGKEEDMVGYRALYNYKARDS